MTEKTSQDYEKDYTKPELRQKLKEEIKQSDKGGKSGQWSARKSQLLKQEYEKQGGDYKHSDQRTEAQENLTKWSQQEWQTDTQENAVQVDKTTRYLPKDVWTHLSKEDRKQANETKIAGSKQGQQHIENTDSTKKTIKDHA